MRAVGGGNVSWFRVESDRIVPTDQLDRDAHGEGRAFGIQSFANGQRRVVNISKEGNPMAPNRGALGQSFSNHRATGGAISLTLKDGGIQGKVGSNDVRLELDPVVARATGFLADGLKALAERLEPSTSDNSKVGKAAFFGALARIALEHDVDQDKALEANGKLLDFFVEGFKAAHDPKKAMQEDVLYTVLEAFVTGNYPNIRFREGPDDPLLEGLSEEQKTHWMRPMQTVRVVMSASDRETLVADHASLTEAAAREHARLVEETGGRQALDAEDKRLQGEYRDLPKGKKGQPEDQERAKELQGQRHKVSGQLRALAALEGLKALAEETPRPDHLGEACVAIVKAKNFAGEEVVAAARSFMERNEGSKHRVVETSEDPDLEKRYRLATVQCVHWPDAAVLSETSDANKHQLVVTDEKHGDVSAVLRYVRSADPDSEGEPRLILERVYPDSAYEAKADLIYHAHQRASEMGIPLLLAEEHFAEGNWETKGDCLEHLEALVAAEAITMQRDQTQTVSSKIGPTFEEYFDSAPVNKSTPHRRYVGNEIRYTNRFTVLLPHAAQA